MAVVPDVCVEECFFGDEHVGGDYVYAVFVSGVKYGVVDWGVAPYSVGEFVGEGAFILLDTHAPARGDGVRRGVVVAFAEPGVPF